MEAATGPRPRHNIAPSPVPSKRLLLAQRVATAAGISLPRTEQDLKDYFWDYIVSAVLVGMEADFTVPVGRVGTRAGEKDGYAVEKDTDGAYRIYRYMPKSVDPVPIGTKKVQVLSRPSNLVTCNVFSHRKRP